MNYVEIQVSCEYDFAKLNLHSTQFQYQFRLRLALFLNDPATNPPNQPGQ